MAAECHRGSSPVVPQTFARRSMISTQVFTERVLAGCPSVMRGRERTPAVSAAEM